MNCHAYDPRGCSSRPPSRASTFLWSCSKPQSSRSSASVTSSSSFSAPFSCSLGSPRACGPSPQRGRGLILLAGPLSLTSRAREKVEQSIWKMQTSASSTSASGCFRTSASRRSLGGPNGVPCSSYVLAFHQHHASASLSGALTPDMSPTAVGNSYVGSASGCAVSSTTSNGAAGGDGAVASPAPCPEVPGEFHTRSQRGHLMDMCGCAQAPLRPGSLPLQECLSGGFFLHRSFGH